MQYDSSTYTDLTDEELIRRVQDGDEAAFAQLAARIVPEFGSSLFSTPAKPAMPKRFFKIFGSLSGKHRRLTRSQQFRCLAPKDSLDDLQKILRCQVAYQGRNPSERGETR